MAFVERATIVQIEADKARLQRIQTTPGGAERFLQIHGRTIEQELAGHNARIAAIRSREEAVIRDNIQRSKEFIVPTHTPFQPQTGTLSTPGQVHGGEFGGIMQFGSNIMGAVGNIVGGIGNVFSAIPNIVNQLLPLIIRLAPVVALVAVLYAVSSIFRLRLNLKWR